MQNISFKANLIVNPNVYQIKSKIGGEGRVMRIIRDYKKFLKQPEIKNPTEGDTIKITKYPYTERDGIFEYGDKKRRKQGWGVVIEFISDKLQKPFVYQYCFGENCTPQPFLSNFKSATFDFLARKMGLKQGSLEKRVDFERRIMEEANK